MGLHKLRRTLTWMGQRTLHIKMYLACPLGRICLDSLLAKRPSGAESRMVTGMHDTRNSKRNPIHIIGLWPFKFTSTTSYHNSKSVYAIRTSFHTQ